MCVCARRPTPDTAHVRVCARAIVWRKEGKGPINIWKLDKTAFEAAAGTLTVAIKLKLYNELSPMHTVICIEASDQPKIVKLNEKL